MISRFKIVSIISTVLFLTAIYLFQNAIFSSLLEYYVKSYCKDCLSTTLIADSTKYGDHVVIFEHPVFLDKEDHQSIHVEADLLLFYFEPRLLQREIDLYVTLVDTKIDLEAVTPEITKILHEENKSPSFFKVNPQIQIVNGILETKANDEIKEVYLTATYNLIGSKELKIQASSNFVCNEDNLVSLQVSEDAFKCLHVQADFKDFNCNTLNQLITPIAPNSPLQLTEGVINGGLKLTLDRTRSKKNKPKVTDIVSDLNLDELSFIYKPLNIYGKMTNVKLQSIENKGFIDLREAFLLARLNESAFFEFNQLMGHALFDLDFSLNEPLRTLDANLFVQDGSLKLDSHELPVFSKFKTGLQIDKGIVTQSIAEGKLFGLDGKIDFDFLNSNQLMTLDFFGETADFLALFPESKQKKLKALFDKEKLSIKGHVKKIIDALSLQEVFLFEGMSEVISENLKKDTLFFGFELEGLGLNETCIKKKIAESLNVTLQNGWLQASHLDLKKYLAPFIIEDDYTKLTGFGDFEGTFNDELVHIVYDPQNVTIENEHFVFEIGSIKRAEECFNLRTGTSFGKVPVRNGSYFEKNSGLLFTDIAADLQINDAKITAPFIEAFCNGIYFLGTHELDLSSPNKGEFDASFHISMMKGKFSQVQDIFSHFNKPYFFLKMPLEADVTLRQNGANIAFGFKNDVCKTTAVIQGEISNGEIKSDHFDVSCQELNVNFDYDHEANLLTFSEISGTLLVGRPDRVEEYLLSGDHVCFTDYIDNEAEFDLWLGDKNRDIIRIVGHTALKALEDNQELTEIFLNKELSHFGNMQLTAFKCILKDWTDIDALDLKFSFKLDSLLSDLQRFSRTGFFFLSRSLLKELNELKKATGDFFVNLEYDKTRSHFNYQLTAKEIEIGSYKFDKALLKGKKNGHLWSIEELKLDQFSLAADIVNRENHCKINFLGMQMASSLLVGLEGEYRREEQTIFSQVNLFEANFESLNEWPKLKKFVEELNPKGLMHATGQLKVEFGGESTLPQVDLLLNASFENCEMKGIQFEDARNVSCHYLSDKALVLRGIKTAVSTTDAILDIDKMEYDMKNRVFSIEGMHFKVPAKKLFSVTNRLYEIFPNIFSKPILKSLCSLKEKDFFEGSINLDVSKPHYALSLILKDGLYHLLGKDHRLEDFILDFDPCEFKLSTKYYYEDYPFHLSFHSKSETFEFGKVVLEDKDLKGEETPLAIYWRRHPNNQIAIETMEGQFSGLYAHLYRNPEISLEEGKFHLVGEVDLDISRLGPILPFNFRTALQDLNLGSGYAFKGNWSIFNGQDFDLFDSTFKGELIGSDFECKGYQFQTLLSDVNYQKNQLLFNRFHIDDPCGTLYADEMKFSQNEKDRWEVNIPLIEVQDFRPSLVRSAGIISIPTRRPFVINQLELEHLEGHLLDFSSFKGYGRFSFKNPHKKNLQNTILAIPAEIISRIGLDPAVLNPVIGTVEYQILDNKILLNRFKDIYSEGKLSKFYLAETSCPSYIDFDGNLFLKLKMKHNNLIFKLAELFIVNVQGNLKKPTYTFQKQTKQPQETSVNEI